MVECAYAENSLPPNFLGIMIPKNPFSFKKSHISLGRLNRLCVMSQLSIIEHNCETGPSRNALSSSDICGTGKDIHLSQSGIPLNKSPSQPTVPAASASLSVFDNVGRDLRNLLITNLEKISLR